ncbi:RNase P modulator RnpM [Vallitalea okinawensis]|uniref:RNase P modulator RnpM n=1 Tax=Vallitalea okinawensis TaxID=2078660 RepID=UPI000CFDCBC1|nr:YlxR family protein [Vallitalea okinawensis]
MKTRKIPLRKCTGCGEMKNKKDLIRVVKDKEGNISIDFTGKKSGRGAYICHSVDCLNLAIKNKGLERSFKGQVTNEIYEQLKSELMSSNE